MTRRRIAIAALIVVVAVVGIRLAITPTSVAGYRVLDDYNVALQVTGANPTWRAVVELRETPTDVTVGISEISLRLGPGSGDERIAYVDVTLREPLGARRIVDASTGAEIPKLAP